MYVCLMMIMMFMINKCTFALHTTNCHYCHMVKVNGMKGVCQFASLRNFDISKGVCLEYMHGVLLGVTKQLMGLWFDTKHKDKPWYCGDAIAVIDERLCSIQPPLNITRIPRSIETHRKYFKGELHLQCTFYMYICLILTHSRAHVE